MAKAAKKMSATGKRRRASSDADKRAMVLSILAMISPTNTISMELKKRNLSWTTWGKWKKKYGPKAKAFSGPTPRGERALKGLARAIDVLPPSRHDDTPAALRGGAQLTYHELKVENHRLRAELSRRLIDELVASWKT